MRSPSGALPAVGAVLALALVGIELQEAAPAVAQVAVRPSGSGLAIREVARFSGFAGSDGTVPFGEILAVDVDATGNAYVLDVQARAVYVFDPEGRHLSTIGREGEGPGEFLMPTGLRVAPDGQFWVFDMGSLRYTVFRLDGEPVGTFRRDFSAGYGGWEAVFGEGGRIYEPTSIRNRHSGEVESVILALEPRDGRLQPVDTISRHLERTFATWPVARSAPAAGGRTESAHEVPIPFSALSRDALDPRGGFWTGHTDEMRFVRRSWNGDILQVVERPDAEPRPVTPDDRRRAIEELIATWGEGVRADPAQMPERMPFWEGFWVDLDGRLWVERFRPPGTPVSALHTWEIYGGDGTYLGAFELPLAGRPTPSLRGNHMIGVVKDDFHVDWLVRFEVVAEEG